MSTSNPGRPAIDDVIDDRVEVILFTIQLVGNPEQIFRLHQLKLVTNRRNHALVALAGLFDKDLIAMFHAFFYHPAPAKAMVSQLAIPLVLVESNFAFFNHLLRKLSFPPRFSAGEFIGFTVAFGVIPGVEKLAYVSALGFLLGLPPVEALGCD